MNPHDLVHKAVESAVENNPRLILEPYYQMKAAAVILAERVIELEKTAPLAKDEFVDECGPLPDDVTHGSIR